MQKRAKGFLFGIVDGSSNKLTIDLSGTATMLLGWAITFDADVAAADIPISISLKVNNEEIVEEVNPEFFSPEFMDDEYYFFPRPLSGTDTITMTAEGQATVNMRLVFYYI